MTNEHKKIIVYDTGRLGVDCVSTVPLFERITRLNAPIIVLKTVMVVASIMLEMFVKRVEAVT